MKVEQEVGYRPRSILFARHGHTSGKKMTKAAHRFWFFPRRNNDRHTRGTCPATRAQQWRSGGGTGEFSLGSLHQEAPTSIRSSMKRLTASCNLRMKDFPSIALAPDTKGEAKSWAADIDRDKRLKAVSSLHNRERLRLTLPQVQHRQPPCIVSVPTCPKVPDAYFVV